ncbi:MAG: histidine phosphatase family protein [Candidatus Gastranaerophilales bacterium]
MYFDRKCKITFISHGATIYSDEYRYSDNINYPPLNDAGQHEMEKMVNFLKKKGIKNDIIYSSPSACNVQSSQVVAGAYKQKIIIKNELRQRACGDWNGLTLNQIIEKNPNEVQNIFLEPDLKIGESCESLNEFINRISNTIEEIVNSNTGNRVIIITHPEVIQAAIIASIDLPVTSMSRFYIKTGTATQITYYNGWASLKYSNYIPA